MVIVQKKPRKKHSWMLKSVTTFAGTATPNTYLGSLILEFFLLKELWTISTSSAKNCYSVHSSNLSLNTAARKKP